MRVLNSAVSESVGVAAAALFARTVPPVLPNGPLLSPASPAPIVAPTPFSYCQDFAAFWQKELANGPSSWYSKSSEYWFKNCTPTLDGVLGGYAYLDSPDSAESSEFFDDARASVSNHSGLPVGNKLCLDAGAGIGRVAKNLLTHRFDKVDIVDRNPRMLEAARAFLGEQVGHLGASFLSSLQMFFPREGFYDCIWLQWVVIYLTDFDLVFLLKRCAQALRPGGFIVIKENVIDDHTPGKMKADLWKDERDNAVMRSPRLLRHIFQSAGLDIVLERYQKTWPKHFMSVLMFALVPSASGSTASGLASAPLARSE